MIAIQDTIVSEDLLEKKFVCDLSKCQGACCIEGDAGAPVEEEEAHILEEELEKIKPFMRKKGKEVVDEFGVFVVGDDRELETPLVNGQECAFVTFDENRIAQCAIELAWKAGKTTFRKPVSCHLYPVRLQKYTNYTAVNYHGWDICQPACSLGEELKVPVFKFLKDALVRKFGKEWYEELNQVGGVLQQNSGE